MQLGEIRRAMATIKDDLWADAAGYGREPKIYLHWTAGSYRSTYPAYHLNILGDGTVEQTRNFTDLAQATYCRNTGSIAITLCCAYGADPDKGLGDYPPTEEQVDCAAQLIAVIAGELGVPIDIYHVMTHAEAADNLDDYYACDPYGPAHGCEKWDLAILCDEDRWMTGGDILRGKAKFYQARGL